MNILGEAESCELLRCLSRDRKSTPKFHYTKQRYWCFHRSWFGEEKSVRQISWFLDLFRRWELIFHCLFIRLHQLSKQTTKQLRIFVCHRGPSTKDSKKMVIFECWLAPTYILLLLTYFRKTNSVPIMITGACAVVTKWKGLTKTGKMGNIDSFLIFAVYWN